MAHDNDDDDGFVDPHAHGACCHACGFAAELEKSGVPPPTPGAPLAFPIDDAGVPRGAAIIVRERGNERDAEVYDVTKADVQFGQFANRREQLAQWRARLPLPLRVEEEAFFYESLYRRLQRHA